MAYTRAQTPQSVGLGTANVTLTFASNNTAGNFLVAIVVTDSATTTVSDNQNGSWTKITGPIGNSTALTFTYLFVLANCKGGVKPTVTFTATGSLGAGFIAEYTGVSTSVTTATSSGSFFDSNGGTTTFSLPTGTGNAVGDLALGGTGDNNLGATTTIATGTTNWAVALDNTSVAPAALLDDLTGVLTAGVQTDSVTTGGASYWPSVIATFAPAGAAAPVGFWQPLVIPPAPNHPLIRMLPESLYVQMGAGASFASWISAVAESVVIAESDVRQFVAGRTADDEITVSDSPGRVVQWLRALDDSALATADSITRLLGFARQPNDQTAMSDSPSRLVQWTRTIAESIAANDSVTRALALTRSATDSIVTSDTAARVFAIVRAVTDASITFADTLTRGGQHAWTVTVSESIALADSVSRLFSGNRAGSESVQISDSDSRLAAFARAVVETSVGVSDAVNRVFSAVRAKSESIALTDGISRLLAFVKALSDTFNTNDAASRAASFLRSASESIGLTDAINRAVGFVRQKTESVATSDAAARVFAIVRSIAETSVSFIDVIAQGGHRTWIVAASESVAIADTVTRLAGFNRSSNESWTIADSDSRLITHVLTFIEAVATSDQVGRVATFIRQKIDSVSNIDGITRLFGAVVGLTESVTQSDAATQLRAFFRQSSESVQFADAASRLRSILVAPIEAFATNDSAHRSMAFVRTVTDALGLTDTILAILSRLILKAQKGVVTASVKQGTLTASASFGIISTSCIAGVVTGSDGS